MNNLEILKEKVDNRPKEWREGQAYFNYAFEENPELVNEIRGSNIDPFYRNDRIEQFKIYLEFNNY